MPAAGAPSGGRRRAMHLRRVCSPFFLRRLAVGAIAGGALSAVLLSSGGPAAGQVGGAVEPAPQPSVCDRTPAIRDAIRAQLNNRACATITSAQLATITQLGHRRIAESFTALQAGDLAGLTGLTHLTLTGRYIFSDEENDFITTGRLATLPAGVFDDLTNLTRLSLYNTQVAVLPPGIFDQLTKLTRLEIGNNRIGALPPGVFDALPLLTHLYLQRNQLTALPPNVFAGLTRLQGFRLMPNPFPSPPLVVHLVRDPLDGSVRAWMPAAAPGPTHVTITATNATPASTRVTVHRGASLSEAATFTPAGAGDVTLGWSLDSPWIIFWDGRANSPLATGEVLTRPDFGARTVAAQRYLVGTAIAPLVLPAAHGEGTLRYHLAQADGSALPAELSFDADTRTLAGTPAAGGRYALLYRAVNPRLAGLAGGEATLPITVTIFYPPPVFAGTVGDQVVQVGEPFSLVLPAATAVAGGLTYHLHAVAPGALPQGLTFDPATRTLAGIPTSLTAVALRYEARDRAGNRVALPFSLIGFTTTVVAGPDPSVCDRSPDVRAAILAALGTRDCARITAPQLAGITALRFPRLSDARNTGAVYTLQAGDFHGLSGLTTLDLARHRLSSLPAGVFAGLEGLTVLRLNGNRLTALPDGVFAGLDRLRELRLEGNAFPDSPLVVHLVEDVHDAGGRSVRAAMPVGAPARMTVAIAATHATPATAALTVPAGGATGAWLVLATSAGTAAVQGLSAAFPADFTYSGPPLVIAGLRAADPAERRTRQAQCAGGVAVADPAAHAGLVADCAALLASREPLRAPEP
ncbi:MAG: putative Ig domain-containing protein, partial [Chloroflexi bacterium]|nr:putative Ig domain-containing protein [Chloroflexota bacterium]